MNILSESGLRYNCGQLAAKNREKCAGETIHFIDSTPVEVCKNNKILRHKVARDCASRGKSTKGWFFGFSNRESGCFRRTDKELENAGIIVKEPKAGDS